MSFEVALTKDPVFTDDHYPICSLSLNALGFLDKGARVLTDEELKVILWNPGANFAVDEGAGRNTFSTVPKEIKCVLWITINNDDHIDEAPLGLTFKMFLKSIEKLRSLSDPSRQTLILIDY